MGSESAVAVVDVALQVGLGVSLAAACGFRMFVPPLILSAAALTGHVHISAPFAWLATPEALVVLAVATVAEIGAYLVPWLDNALDALAAPAAVVAGTVMSASVLTGMDPLLRWSLAVIAGGGAAGLVHGATAMARGISSLASGGVANHIVAFGELAAAALLSLFALLAPIFAGFALCVGGAVLLLALRRRSLAAAERRAAS